MKPLIKRRFGTIGFIILTIIGLRVIETLYDLMMPIQVQSGQLLSISFVPFTYPPAYWLAHLLLMLVLLGGLAWAFGLRRGWLLTYLAATYFISLLGPLWLVWIYIWVLPAHR